MPLVHETTVYDVHECWVFPLATDPIAGPSPTYGTGVQAHGISQVKVDPNFVTAELKGDGGAILAKRGRVDRFKFSGTYGLLNFDVLHAIIGGTVADPNANTATYTFDGGTVLPYFGMGLAIEDVDSESGLGELQVILYKVQITGGTLISGQTDQFGQPTFDAEAFRPKSNNHMMQLRLQSAITPIAMV